MLFPTLTHPLTFLGGLDLIMHTFPSLVIHDAANHYACHFSWIAYERNQLAAIALLGPESATLGASSWIMTHAHDSVYLGSSDTETLSPADSSGAAFPSTLHLPSHSWIRRTGSIRWAASRRLTQTLLLPQDALTPSPDATLNDFHVLHWGDSTTWPDTVWAFLQHQALPLHPTWQSAFFAHLATSPITITPMSTWHYPHTPDPFLITVTGLNGLADYVTQGIRRGWFPLPAGFGPNPPTPLPADATPDDYLRAWAPALGHQLDQLIRPRIVAGSPIPAAWTALKRQPYPAQSDVIQAAAATLQDTSSALMTGEPGTGKTLMMSIVPWHLARLHSAAPAFRTLVIAPDHLVPKWEREILATIPNAVAHRMTRWTHCLPLTATLSTAPVQPEYWIIGRDRAKLGYRRRFAGVWRSHSHQWVCPDCGQPLQHPDTHEPWPDTITTHTRTNDQCPACHTPLWTADARLRRMSPIEYLKRYATKQFDLVIVDEVHEAKGLTEQGHTLALASRVGKKLLVGTGTLGSGFADDLHLLQYRLNPASMVHEQIAHKDLHVTQQRYGRIQTTIRYDRTPDETERVYGRRAKGRRTVKRLPGLSPLWYATKLVDRAVFIRLDDLGQQALPSYQEEVQWINMDPDQATWYRTAIGHIRALAQNAGFSASSRFLGKLLAMSLTVADEPWLAQSVWNADDLITWQPPLTLTPDRHYPKEDQIVRDVLQERAAGRRVWIYTTYTQTHPQATRLASILRQAGLQVAVLTTDIPRMQREAWITEQVRQGVEVCISHPQLVETGLDLLAFPTLFWYSTGYNLFRLRQASRRAWRIGQHDPCLVRFYAYAETFEETALRWMAQKLDMAQALEGDLSLEGLQRLTMTEDGGNALARALVDDLPVTGDVHAIWQAAAQPAFPSLPVSPDIIPAPPIHREPIALTIRSTTPSRRRQPANQLAWLFDTPSS